MLGGLNEEEGNQNKLGILDDHLRHPLDLFDADNNIKSNSKRRRIRVGIDVGGTFTKAVAIDMVTGKIVGKTTVPTTHTSNRGVSTGILESLSDVMNRYGIENSEIELVSHSTTQAVNALLEGDTAKVGIIGMGVGLEKSNIVKRTNIKRISLEGKGKTHIETCYRYLDTSNYLEEDQVMSSVSELEREGAKVIVVSEAYGVDDPSNEDFVENVIKTRSNDNIPVVAAHDLTGIYGLEIRTMTAVINASILPKAITTSRFVKSAVRNKLGIPRSTSLMVMKGDGGVTYIDAFETKPIVTVLSGPAASVAGALLHLRVLNGVFVEVGGTSTNVCVIKDGKPKVNYATIMQHPTCIRSLDVRVVNAAGGSIVMLSKDKRKILDVGPRSAHIAGLTYCCFAKPADLENARIVEFSPDLYEDITSKHSLIATESDNIGDQRSVYAVIKGKERPYAITTTCAANALDLIPNDDYAKGDPESAKIALSILAKEIGSPMEKVANQILDIATDKISRVVNPILKEYSLAQNRSSGFFMDRKEFRSHAENRRGNIPNGSFTIIGGGGAASVLCPQLAKTLGMNYKKADNAEVISSIGVAAAMIYEELEKTVDANPKTDVISLMMDEVKDRALAKGALPESITIQSEYISDRSILRVTATGNMSLDIGTVNSREITNEEAETIAYSLFGTSTPLLSGKREMNRNLQDVKRIDFNVKNYHIFEYKRRTKKLFSFISRSQKTQLSVLILDKFGRVRLCLTDVSIVKGAKEEVLNDLLILLGGAGGYRNRKKDEESVEGRNVEGSQWDLPPQVHLLDDIRLIDFSNLTSSENLSKVIRDEVQKSSSHEVLAVIKM